MWDFKEEYKKMLTDFGAATSPNSNGLEAYRIKSERATSPLSSARKSPMLKEKKGEMQIVLNNMIPPAAGDGGSPKSIKKGSIAQITAMSSPRKQSDVSSLGGQFNRSF